MKHSIPVLSVFLVLTLISFPAMAQPPGGGFGGGGFGGGGFGGGGFGGGGPPGGMSFGGRGDRGGDRGGGDRGDRGGDRGDRGGGDRGGGGGFGGDRGGFGGGGGFDPSSFLTRMDTNGNGMLDPEEAQGPARFMLDRMARSNPKIDITKPIPMSVLTESFQQMRSGGPGSDGRFGSSEEEPILEKNSLVPGFATVKVEKLPVPGFGASGEKFTVQVEEGDLKNADDKMRQYDRNNDQHLDENELKEGRWSDSPMQYDKNRDGKLSRQELATRYARRRLASGVTTDSSKKIDDMNNKRNRENREVVDDKKDKSNPYEKRASYRTTDADGKMPPPAGLPEWFTRNDTNSDNQVEMKELNKKWTQDSIQDFLRFDTNEDGFITVKECLVGVKKGHIFGAGGSAPVTMSTAPVDNNSTVPTIKASGAPVADSKAAEMRKWLADKMKKDDKDGNGFLSPEEVKDAAKFAESDTNKDGRIDLDEYVAARGRKR